MTLGMRLTMFILIFLQKKWKGKPQITEPDKFAEWSWFNIPEIPEKVFIGHQKFVQAFLEKSTFIDSTLL